MKRNAQRGFTIVEMIVVIFMMTVMSSMMAPILLQGVECVAYDQSRNHLVENSRLSFDRVAEEVWSTQHVKGLRTASGTRLRVRSAALKATPCDDGSDPEMRTVSIRKIPDDTLLRMSLTLDCTPEETIGTQLSAVVQNLKFVYFDENGAEVASPITGADRYLVRAVRMKAMFNNPDTVGTRLEAPYSTVSEFRMRRVFTEEDYLP